MTAQVQSVLSELQKREAVISVLSTLAALGLIQFVNNEEMRTVAEALALLAGSMQYLVAFVMRQSGEKQVSLAQTRSIESDQLAFSVREIHESVTKLSEELSRVQSRLDELESGLHADELVKRIRELTNGPV